MCIIAYGDMNVSNSSSLLSWTLLGWTKLGQFVPQWSSGKLKQEIASKLNPTVSPSFALAEGLCTASGMFKMVNTGVEEQFLVSFVGAALSAAECALCGHIQDVNQHASRLANEDILQSYVSVRPTPALKQVWDSAALPNTHREKQVAHLTEVEYKYFFGHRVNWPVQLTPPHTAVVPAAPPAPANTRPTGVPDPSQPNTGGSINPLVQRPGYGLTMASNPGNVAGGAPKQPVYPSAPSNPPRTVPTTSYLPPATHVPAPPKQSAPRTAQQAPLPSPAKQAPPKQPTQPPQHVMQPQHMYATTSQPMQQAPQYYATQAPPIQAQPPSMKAQPQHVQYQHMQANTHPQNIGQPRAPMTNTAPRHFGDQIATAPSNPMGFAPMQANSVSQPHLQQMSQSMSTHTMPPRTQVTQQAPTSAPPPAAIVPVPGAPKKLKITIAKKPPT